VWGGHDEGYIEFLHTRLIERFYLILRRFPWIETWTWFCDIDVILLWRVAFFDVVVVHRELVADCPNGSLEPVHTAIDGEIVPDQGKDQHTEEHDHGVVHVADCHTRCEREQEHHNHEGHKGHRDECTCCALRKSQRSRPHVTEGDRRTRGPSENGPGSKSFAPRYLAAMGIE
jgi:hypothetical protein